MREGARDRREAGKFFSKSPDLWNDICTGSYFYPVQMSPHLYWVVAPPGINAPPNINVRPTNLYRAEPPPGAFVPSWLEEAPTGPCEGAGRWPQPVQMRAFVPR
jgi:hypothetical protein